MDEPRSDEALMLAFKAGDAGAFEVLVRRHRNAVFGYLSRLLKNPQRAEDLVQETWLRIIRAKYGYESSARFTTWLYVIARNLWRDSRDRAASANTESLDASAEDETSREDSLPSMDPLPDSVAQSAEVRPHLELALGKISVEQREVFLLHELHGMSFQEIGEITGVPLNTAKSRYRYAIASLRRTLAPLKDEAPSVGAAQG